MSKPKVLLLGEHPLGVTGNSGMMHALLSNFDIEELDVTCLVAGTPPDSSSLLFRKFPIPVVDISEHENFWGHNRVGALIEKAQDISVFLMVGLDIWRYIEIFRALIDMRDQRGFKMGAIFPYDLAILREDWVEMIRSLDFPCVYSQYGYDMLKDHVPHLRYYRPHLHLHDIWERKNSEYKLNIRRNLFQGTGISNDIFMVGYVGCNQYRKDPQRLLKAFKLFNDKRPDSVLYMHTEKIHGVYNLPQYAVDVGIKQGQLLTKPEKRMYPLSQMPNIYNALDVLVNCSIQEGLSWTVIESMLCGTPVIMSDTTAHKELMIDENLMVDCTIPSYIPIKAASGQSWVDSKSCSTEDIVRALEYVYSLSDHKREDLIQKGIKFATEWKNGHGDINKLMTEMIGTKRIVVRADRKQAVLFAQHSAAGDVFMTTRCLKGIKKCHPDLPLHYMTQTRFHDIVKGHPDVDEVIDWNEWHLEKGNYLFCYNPHGDVILPGHWGRNSNSILSDFYWKILRVTPDDFYIHMEKPEIFKVEEYPFNLIAIVHTTGGDGHFRTYKYMKDVCQYLASVGFMTIQLGGSDDFPADADVDFRGKLSYPESAWIMNEAKVAITVDSYMSHLAGALGIDQVCLFGSGNYNVVKPNQVDGHLISMVPDYVSDCQGLGPCSGAVRDCAIPCTSRHDPRDIVIAIDDLLKGNYDNPVRQKEGEL